MILGARIAGGIFLIAASIGLAPGLGPVSAFAGEYRLCNQTSYVLDAALGVQSGQTSATQGWFRFYPGGCKILLSRTTESERYFVYMRTPEAYNTSPLPAAASNLLCVAEDNFLIPGAENCADSSNHLVSFTEVTADTNGITGQTILTGEYNFDPEQARIAGLQRLLTKAGFDPGGIDGNQGEKTSQAIVTFRATANIAAGEGEAILFEALLAAANEELQATGLTLCNDTDWTIFAAAGTSAGDTTRIEGWFELPPGDCTRAIREPLSGDRLHVFAQAHDGNGFPVIHDGAPLRWGGDTELCTKATRFETRDHENCRAQGLNANGFTNEGIGASAGRVIRFGIDQ